MKVNANRKCAMKVKALNKATGEVIELAVDTPEQIVEAWRIAQEYDKTCAALKDQLKKLVPTLVGPNGLSEPVNGYQFRQSHIQRMNYDKTVMRELLDPDDFDVLLKPYKPAVDKYLKENLETLKDVSTARRHFMLKCVEERLQFKSIPLSIEQYNELVDLFGVAQ
jgi:hypothetical protein